jgi:hypothetical protein
MGRQFQLRPHFVFSREFKLNYEFAH